MRLAGRVVLALVSAALGVGVGVLGAFVHNMSAQVFGLAVPIGLAPALGGLVGLLVLTGSVLRSRVLVLVPAAGWATGVLPLASPRPEGDLVVAGTLSGYALLLGGALLVGMCMTLPYDQQVA